MSRRVLHYYCIIDEVVLEGNLGTVSDTKCGGSARCFIASATEAGYTKHVAYIEQLVLRRPGGLRGDSSSLIALWR